MISTMIILALIVFVIALLMRRNTKDELEEPNKASQTRTGIGAVALARNLRKEASKREVLQLLKNKGELTNAEIRKSLGIASRTTVKYMSELEREGKVTQVGATGRGVKYKLKSEK